MRPPKDLTKYITPWLAALRLAHLAVERVGSVHPKCRVRWELKIRYYYPPEAIKDHKGPCIASAATFSSGEEAPELTGNAVESDEALLMYIKRHFDDLEMDPMTLHNRAEAALHDYHEHQRRQEAS